MLDDLGSAADITQQVARLLRAADANQRLPTPVDDIVAAAELVSTREVAISESMIERAPETMRALLRSAKRKILGVLDRRERVIQIAPNSSAERERFVTCHEVAHHIFPWQADLAVLGDDSRTLAPSVTRLFEQEANQGAAEILFQQSLLATIARDYPVEMSTPLQLADLFGASAHATFRRWLEGLDETACGLVLDVADTGDQRKRYEQLLTPRWQARFGPDGYPRRLGASEFPRVLP